MSSEEQDPDEAATESGNPGKNEPQAAIVTMGEGQRGVALAYVLEWRALRVGSGEIVNRLSKLYSISYRSGHRLIAEAKKAETRMFTERPDHEKTRAKLVRAAWVVLRKATEAKQYSSAIAAINGIARLEGLPMGPGRGDMVPPRDEADEMEDWSQDELERYAKHGIEPSDEDFPVTDEMH